MRCNRFCRMQWSSTSMLLVSMSTVTPAQTIGDYSRAQSAVIERSLSQIVGQPLLDRAASGADPASGRPNPPSMVIPPSTPSARIAGSTIGAMRDGLQVTGVFATKARMLAEVVVDGIPYWLSEGDAVPRTAWRMVRIQADRVELERVSTPPVRRLAKGVQAWRVVELPPAN